MTTTLARALSVVLGVAAIAAPAASVDAAEMPRHSVSATSSAQIQLKPDGGWRFEARATRFEAYAAIPDLLLNAIFPPRLATITTTSVQDGDVLEAQVTVAVDDMSGPALRRIVEFSDPGNEGKVVGGLYFVTTEWGCCAVPNRYRVRALETGRALFAATGSGEMGSAIWMQIPNAKPTVERWVAFDSRIGRSDRPDDQELMGELAYGDRNGALSRAVVRFRPTETRPEPEELALELASCAIFRWVEPGQETPPPTKEGCPTGRAYFPESLFSLEKRDPKRALDGFEIELSVEGLVYATIPVTNDRLDLDKAQTVDWITLTLTAGP